MRWRCVVALCRFSILLCRPRGAAFAASGTCQVHASDGHCAIDLRRMKRLLGHSQETEDTLQAAQRAKDCSYMYVLFVFIDALHTSKWEIAGLTHRKALLSGLADCSEYRAALLWDWSILLPFVAS